MTLRSLLRNRMLWIWTGVWAFGCALMVVQVGYWYDESAAVLTTGIYLAPANMMIRNLTLIVASADAVVTMFLVIRNRPEKKLSNGAGADRIQLGAAAS